MIAPASQIRIRSNSILDAGGYCHKHVPRSHPDDFTSLENMYYLEDILNPRAQSSEHEFIEAIAEIDTQQR